MRAEVIGVNSAIYTGTGQFSGVGFAVPSDTISKVIPALITSGSYKHPWLGITGRDMTPGLADALGLKEPKGFLVIDTVKGSPADQAGIRGGTRDAVVDGNHIMLGGDVIIQVDGNDVRKIDDILVYLQREKSVGDPLKLLVLRDGASKEITVTLGARPSTLESP
jgi:S1-C subfamily serine protease